MSTPLLAVPRPYPGCVHCAGLVREWTAVTEPAAPEYDRDRANHIAGAIVAHRRQDEERAPAL
ncbi:hypothetical protein [Streptomyces sp. NPDC058620]|uniref:hypothetical protein n=1 Tax=Streptomyces sp. NPDC058620 TaxID=3346560 RepID=UPI00364F5384